MLSPIELPKVVAIWRHSNESRTNGSCNSALFHCKKIKPGVWEFNIMKNPLQYIENGTLIESNEDEWLGARLHIICIQNNGNMNTRIRYDAYVIVSNVGKPSIPVVRIENKCKVLPLEFSRLDSRENRQVRFAMCPGLLVYYSRDDLLGTPETTASPCCSPKKSEFSIPPHIINTYIEYIIKKRETCPIEFTDLTMENICITSCGHVMTRNALETWLNKFHSCPVCRKPLTSTQIYVPKDLVEK